MPKSVRQHSRRQQPTVSRSRSAKEREDARQKEQDRTDRINAKGTDNSNKTVYYSTTTRGGHRTRYKTNHRRSKSTRRRSRH